MKKTVTFLLLGFMLITRSSLAQRYKLEFDQFLERFNADNPTPNLNLWYSNKCKNNLMGDIEDNAQVMSSLIVMYEKTHDIKYLKILVKHIAHIIDRRDDQPLNNALTNQATWSGFLENQTGVTTPEPFRNTVCSSGYTVFSPPRVEHAWVYESGLFTYPMASFCHIVLRDNLQSTLSFNTTTYPLSDPAYTARYSNQSFGTIVSDLLQKIEQTIQFHETNLEWKTIPPSYLGTPYTSNPRGQYVFNQSTILYDADDHIFYQCGYPLNMQHALGKTLLKMYLIKRDFSVTTTYSTNFYLDKVIRLGNLFDYEIQQYSAGGNYKWRYFDIISIAEVRANDPGFNPKADDISHGAISMEFAYLLYKNNIPITIGSSTPIFNSTDMAKFVQTFKNVIYNHYLNFDNLIDGASAGLYENYYYKDISFWMCLQEFDPEIFHMIEDAYLRKIVNGFPSSTEMQGIAYCAAYQDILDPVTFKRFCNCPVVGDVEDATPQYLYEWGDVATGDFDGDGIDEIFTVDNKTGNLYLYDYKQSSDSLYLQAVWVNNSSYTTWHLAAGNFDNTDSKLEIVATRNSDDDFFMYKYNPVTDQIQSMTSFAESGPWAGIAGGNFDGTGNDEFAVVNKSTGDIKMFKYNPGTNTVSFFKSFVNGGSNANYADIAAGDFTGDGKDEVVVARNYDGNIYMYGYNGSIITGIGQELVSNSNMKWVRIGSGNFNLYDPKDEFVVTSASDGDMHFYRYDNTVTGSIASTPTEHFPSYSVSGFKYNGIVSGGRFTSQCYDNLLNLRNYDNAMHLYNVRYSGETIQGDPCEYSYRTTQSEDLKEVNTKEAPESRLTVYPNPSYESVTINSGIYEIENIELSNVAGQVLSVVPVNDKNYHLQVNNLEEGIYFVKITYINGLWVTRKVVVTR